MRVDGEERQLGEGAEIEIRRGQVHQVWNLGAESAWVRWVTSPAGRTGEWFRTLDALFRPGGDLAEAASSDCAALLEEYDDVFRLDTGG